MFLQQCGDDLETHPTSPLGLQVEVSGPLRPNLLQGLAELTLVQRSCQVLFTDGDCLGFVAATLMVLSGHDSWRPRAWRMASTGLPSDALQCI